MNSVELKGKEDIKNKLSEYEEKMLALENSLNSNIKLIADCSRKLKDIAYLQYNDSYEEFLQKEKLNCNIESDTKKIILIENQLKAYKILMKKK
jgi:hypothetical protein